MRAPARTLSSATVVSAIASLIPERPRACSPGGLDGRFPDPAARGARDPSTGTPDRRRLPPVLARRRHPCVLERVVPERRHAGRCPTCLRARSRFGATTPAANAAAASRSGSAGLQQDPGPHALSSMADRGRVFSISTTFYSACCGEIAEEPVPRLAPWPDGKHWALVLTHDVETGPRLPQHPRSPRRRASSRLPLVLELRAPALRRCRCSSRRPLGERLRGGRPRPVPRRARSRIPRDADRPLAPYPRVARSLARRWVPLARDASQLGADAAPAVRLRLVLSGHRPLRAPSGWMPQLAAVLQRRPRRASDHASCRITRSS